MALYPTPSGQRIAYDRDGSAPFMLSTAGVVTSLTTAQGQALNDESDSTTFNIGGNGATKGYVGVVFSDLWDLTGYFFSAINFDGTFTALDFDTSVDTTNGLDGTWVTQQANYVNATVTVPNYRSAIQALALSGIRGVRIRSDSNGNTGTIIYHSLHFYGNLHSGQNPDSLRIWQPVINAELTTVEDFSDIARGSVSTFSFRVHNQSATKTASTITVSLEALTDASPSLIGQYQLSTDNITYATSITIPNLGPGATSAVLYIRDTVAVGAAISLWAARLVAAAGTFA